MKRIILISCILTALSFTSCSNNNISDQGADTNIELTSDTTDALAEENQSDAPVKNELTIITSCENDTYSLLAGWLGTEPDQLVKRIESGELEWINVVEVDASDNNSFEYYKYLADNKADLIISNSGMIKAFTDNTDLSMDLNDLMITSEDKENAFDYTWQLACDTEEKTRAVTLFSNPGVFVYNSEIVSEYLGITSPDKMQEAVSDWEKFRNTASALAEASDGKTALADSTEGIWQAYCTDRNTPSVEYIEEDIFTYITPITSEFNEYFCRDLTALWETGGVSHTSKNTSQWISNGAEGATAGYFLSFEEADKVLDSISDKSVTDQQNKWEVCSGPASFYNDDVMLIVCTGTDNTEECREIIRSVLSDNENAYKLAENSKRFVNNKTAMKKVLSEHNTESLISSKAIKNKENAFRCYYSNAERIHLNYKFSAYDTSYNKIFLDTVKQYALEQHYSIEDTMSVFFKNAESEFN